MAKDSKKVVKPSKIKKTKKTTKKVIKKAKKITSENSLKNLKHYKKGQTGNKKGRPKGSRNLSTMLKEFVETSFEAVDPFTNEKSEKTMGEWLCLNLVVNAIKGNIRAAKIVFDRIEGKVSENFNIKIDESANVEAIKAKMYSSIKRNGWDEKEE